MARWQRPCAWLVCSLVVVTGARAQNGSNYRILNNGGDVVFVGVGAGGAATAEDGLLTFVAGEDLRGSRLTPFGDYGYRQAGFTESACVLIGIDYPSLRFPQIAFIELDGLNGNVPAVFTNPTCSLPSFPLGSSGFVPYGTGPGSTASFVVSSSPFSSHEVLLPNNGLDPVGAGGVANMLAFASVSLPLTSTGFCWEVKFQWVGTAVTTADDIDGLVHYVTNSPDGNQYWMLSDNEQNLWQSQSVGTEADMTRLIGLPANVDYAMHFVDRDPVTVATLAPRAGPTLYSSWTTNVSDEFGLVQNPNGGFDVGRGSAAVSFAGKAGVANPNTGVGNQDPSQGPGVVTTLGFATWDNGGDGDGSVRLTWVSWDFLGFAGGNPDTDPGVIARGGVRVPVVSAGLLQPITRFGFQLFGHVTDFGFADPLPGFGVGPIGGASRQIPLGHFRAPCVGLAVNLTYGTVGREGELGTPGEVTFDQGVAATSGSRQLFLFD